MNMPSLRITSLRGWSGVPEIDFIGSCQHSVVRNYSHIPGQYFRSRRLKLRSETLSTTSFWFILASLRAINKECYGRFDWTRWSIEAPSRLPLSAFNQTEASFRKLEICFRWGCRTKSFRYQTRVYVRIVKVVDAAGASEGTHGWVWGIPSSLK